MLETVKTLVTDPHFLAIVLGLCFSYGLAQWLKRPLMELVSEKWHSFAVRTVGIIGGAIPVLLLWPDQKIRWIVALPLGTVMPALVWFVYWWMRKNIAPDAPGKLPFPFRSTGG